jgi:2-amino-4-hydroxy-6-hydroxymethyldihydropteridine diphosphokinase
MSRVYIAAGSNIRPAERLVLAARELRRRFPDIGFSGCYRNVAFGFKGEDFINTAAGFDTSLSVEALIGQLHEVEALCGRGRDDPKWAPRAMDLDLLLYDELVAVTPLYKLPRPDLLRRAYMLGPMAELAPRLKHPVAGRTLEELWQEFAQSAHPLQRLALDLNRP